MKVLIPLAPVSGGNPNKKRKRIKPLCDSSNSSSDDDRSVRKKSMTSDGSSRSSTSKLSKEKDRSSRDSSTSSEDEEDRKKEKKRFISSGNESSFKTGGLSGNIYSRSKSVDLPSKFGVLNKKKTPELVKRQYRYE
jgi:hypothetical protein